MAYLAEFFNESQLLDVEPNSTFYSLPHIKLPELAIFGPQFDRQMAIIDKAKFNLREVVNATKKDEKMFASMSHYSYSRMLENMDEDSTSWDVFSVKDRMLVVLGIVVLLILVGFIHLSLKFKNLVVFVTAATKPAYVMSKSSDLNLQYGQATVIKTLATQSEHHATGQGIQAIIPLDIMVLVVVCVFILVGVIWMVIKRHRRSEVAVQSTHRTSEMEDRMCSLSGWR